MHMTNHDPLPSTGERFLPTLDGNIAFEHLHRYALACLLARRCRLVGGDGSLERAVSEGFKNAAGALDAHVVEPLASLRAEMFSTLRDR
jgi:hypothetical protein